MNSGWRGDKENIEGRYWRKEERISWREGKDWKRGKEGNFWRSEEGNNCRDRDGNNRRRDKVENFWGNLFFEMLEVRFLL